MQAYPLPPAHRFVRDPETLHVNMRKLKLQTLKKYVRLNRIQTPSTASTHQELAKIVAEHFCSTLQVAAPYQRGSRAKKSTFYHHHLSLSLCIVTYVIAHTKKNEVRVRENSRLSNGERVLYEVFLIHHHHHHHHRSSSS